MYRHSGHLSECQRGGENKENRHSVSLCKGQSGGVNTVFTHSGPLSNGQRGDGRQCTDTQDLYLNVRGEVGDTVQTLRTSIQTSEGRWETVYTHSAPLSKGQRGFGTTVYRHSGPLDEGQRGGGRHYTDTQDLSVNI